MIIKGDCLQEMAKMEANSIDFIVTDPPYGLHFMGKDWDKFKKSNFDESGDWNTAIENGKERKVRKIANGNSHAGTYDESGNDEFQEFIRLFGIEALRVLKPGGYIAMFGAPRRHHRQMSGLEDAGFEIRDCIMWLFGQGFPKSHNFGKKMDIPWHGYGTALKPAYEPILICMKPLDGTFAQNADIWGVAGINVDESRIEAVDQEKLAKNWDRETVTDMRNGNYGNGIASGIELTTKAPSGRWPANVILDEETGQMVGEPSRFFYCAKASSKERNKGCEGLPLQNLSGVYGEFEGDGRGRQTEHRPMQNNHPTVKPIALMKYIIKLLAPPGDPILLDPFAGSGSTLIAAKELGYRFIGIEKQADYCEIAQKRLDAA